MNYVIIDNCIISKIMPNGICIRSINLAKKINPNLNLDILPIISTGNKYLDNKLIQQLSDGIISFDDLIAVYLN